MVSVVRLLKYTKFFEFLTFRRIGSRSDLVCKMSTLFTPNHSTFTERIPCVGQGPFRLGFFKYTRSWTRLRQRWTIESRNLIKVLTRLYEHILVVVGLFSYIKKGLLPNRSRRDRPETITNLDTGTLISKIRLLTPFSDFRFF